ncbi:DNA cytosine methyltransferase [Parafrankia elaeagni]|uniref:DNA cytosine methyltransferase n=1 Tax=Parafrankia elaeagni TaxID=222534 RepID=UPI0003A3D9D7|nr:DNA cytosine methyltransferase [Parafrankia elaeagni]
MYTVVDLFAGCGGGSMGFRKAGFAPVAAVEIDDLAAAAYEANLGLRPIVRDIRDVSLDDLRAAGVVPGELTLLFGCPPCQSFTVLRRGQDASAYDRRRNDLIYEYLRMVRELRPRHLAFENVPGLVTGRWSSYFEVFRKMLADLEYKAVSHVVDAADYGVPQRRKRVLVVASRVAEPQLPPATHHAPDALPMPGQRLHLTVREAIGALRPLASGQRDPDDRFHVARRHSEIALRRLRAVPEGGGRADLPDDLVLACHRDHQGHYDIYGRMWWNQVAPTLTSGCTNVTRGRFAHPEQDRAITLREAMLLQTFPSDAQLAGGVEAMALQVGNAVPSLLARRIGEQIAAMEAASRSGALSAGLLEISI